MKFKAAITVVAFIVIVAVLIGYVKNNPPTNELMIQEVNDFLDEDVKTPRAHTAS